MREFTSKLIMSNGHYYLFLADIDVPSYIENKRVSLTINNKLFIDDFDFKTHRINNHYALLAQEAKILSGESYTEDDDELIKDLEVVYYPDQDNTSYTRFIIDDLIRNDKLYFLDNDSPILSLEADDVTVNVQLSNELRYFV